MCHVLAYTHNKKPPALDVCGWGFDTPPFMRPYAMTNVYEPEHGRNTGHALAAERERRGITQDALARRMGVTPARVSAIESGRNKLRPETITRYMACLELITHDQADVGDFEMRLTVTQVQWLSIFSELEEHEQQEAIQLMRDRYAERLNSRIHEQEVRSGTTVE